jgi:hypothetical protein
MLSLSKGQHTKNSANKYNFASQLAHHIYLIKSSGDCVLARNLIKKKRGRVSKAGSSDKHPGTSACNARAPAYRAPGKRWDAEETDKSNEMRCALCGV